MPSIIPGFEYDVFISYRHNDNKSGWVTEFVKALEEELAATVKEPLTIYFDKNPQDGLLETHSVDKSLEGKLKCLIFIPIISQTYCDPKSFAWQHEFCAFNQTAMADSIGRDISLNGGNVASRILPVKIHDLDAADALVMERELGGPLRAVEFIYREAGVNRPLRSTEENPTKNLAQTVYRNQLNKVAQAIKQIITAIKDPTHHGTHATRPATPIQAKSKYTRVLIASFVVLALAALGYLGATQLRNGPEANVVVDKSIAVLPFVNMSNDPDQEFFSDGISEEVLNLLAKVPELKVIGRTSSFYFKGKNEDLRMIGEKLGAANILEGSVRKEGNQVRITAQLIRASDGVHLWSDTYDRKLEKIFDLQDEIAGAVLKELKLKLLGSSYSPGASPPNSEAYNFILKGNYFADQRNIPLAIDYYSKALALDSNNARAWSSLAYVRILEGNGRFEKFASGYEAARKMAAKAMMLDPSSVEGRRVKGLFSMWWDFDWQSAEDDLKAVLELEPGNQNAYRNLGQLYRAQGLYEKALAASVKSMDVNPLNVVTIGAYADVLANLGRFEDAIAALKPGLEINKDYINFRLLNLYLMTGKYDLVKPVFDVLPDDDKFLVAPMVWFALRDENKMEEALSAIRQRQAKGLIGSYDVAVNYAFLNRKELALDYLEKALKEKYRCVLIKCSPQFKSIFHEPRFEKVLKSMKLSPG
ncbi:MAG TPA: tetratricopeptide repeat protein [Cyclobacteriaceae bacterium]|nr:tetratricopeptide repeat protein [Cyclobacteriaceae bacterium]